MRTLKPQAALQQGNEVIVVAARLVGADELLQLVAVHDDVQATDLRQPELAALNSRLVDLLPRACGVGFARSINSRAELVQFDQRGRQARVAVDDAEHGLGGLVHPLRVAAVADLHDLRTVGAVEQLLNLIRAVGARQGKQQLRVDGLVLRLLARHLQVRHKVLVALCLACQADDVRVVVAVVRLHKRLDGLLDHAVVQLRTRELSVHLGIVTLLRKLVGSVHLVEVLDQHLNGLHVVAKLFEDGESLVVQLRPDSDVGDVGRDVVVQAVDVVHDARLVSFDGSQDQQVLQVAVAAERAALQDNLLKQLNQLLGKVGIHERLHCH
mmetsp:Transcript_11520/g.29032  ORF Transcript_11520/g.29032 Transcript_11520/m.29032 type:complete len:325 (+) Transcript_11520:1247-2221(+)